MKRIIPLLLTLAFCILLCACGKNTGTFPSAPESNTQQPTTAKPTHAHTWSDATCTEPKTCATCGETDGEALGHTWTDATCISPKACTACSITEGDTTDHNHQESARAEATASQDGSVSYTCPDCGDTYTEVLPATGSIGLQYSDNGDGTCTLVGIGTCTDTQIIIPSQFNGSTVTAIGNRAFYSCTSITEITIPDSVTSIGSQIFYKCDALHTVYYNSPYGSADNLFMSAANIKKVVFGSSSIPAYVCYNAASIEEVIILSSVTEIKWEAFKGCRGLITVTIPDSVTRIGSRAFEDCSSLQSVNIPASVAVIGPFAFMGCSNLSAVHITDLAAWCRIPFDGFDQSPLNCGANLYLNGELVTVLEIPHGITSIHYAAFMKCPSLEAVIIPDSVSHIGSWAFGECVNLTSITIPDSVTSIGSSAFTRCSNLTSIIIPDSVTNIGEHAFDGCTNLATITIPSSISSFDYGTFARCTNLTSITLPDSVNFIDHYAFEDCTSLTTIHFGGTIEQWNAIVKNTGWDDDTGKYTVYCADGEISK